MSLLKLCAEFWICSRTKLRLGAGAGSATISQGKSASPREPSPLRIPPGCSANTELYPRTTKLLTSILRGMSSASRFATVTLQRNVQIQMHRDLGNQPGTDNIIVPCSRWMGGCLWVRNDGWTHLLDSQSGSGTMIRVGLPFASFDPHQPHAATPWSEGNRTILIGIYPQAAGQTHKLPTPAAVRLGLQSFGGCWDTSDSDRGQLIQWTQAVSACLNGAVLDRINVEMLEMMANVFAGTLRNYLIALFLCTSTLVARRALVHALSHVLQYAAGDKVTDRFPVASLGSPSCGSNKPPPPPRPPSPPSPPSPPPPRLPRPRP